MSLPNDYLPLEYIESTGTQWIETGLYAYALDIITIVGEFTELKNCYILGCHNSGRYRKIGIRMVDDVPKFIASCGYWNEDVPGGIAHMGLIVTDATLGKHTFIYNYARNSLTVDGTEYALYNGLNDPSTDREAPGVNVERHNTMVLFGYRHDSEFDIPGRANFKLYECTIQQNGEVVRNYVPVARLSDKEIGLYDTINNTFTTSSDTTGGNFNFELNSYKTIVNAPRLPSGYTELDYIQSTNQQTNNTTSEAAWIDTGVTPSSNLKTECVMSFDTLSTSSSEALCGTNAESNVRWGWGFANYSTLTKFYAGMWSQNNISTVSRDTAKHTFILDSINSKFIIDSTETTMSYTIPSITPTASISLFGRNSGNSSSINKPCNATIYSFKTWDNNVLTHNFVPCKRNSDNEIGMYDTVDCVFIAHKGNKTFTAGPIASIEKLSYKTIVNNNINYNSKVYL